MAGIVQGIPGGVQPSPQLGPNAIPIEATADRELRVADRLEGRGLDDLYNMLADIRNELMMFNNNMFPAVDFTQERLTYTNTDLTDRR